MTTQPELELIAPRTFKISFYNVSELTTPAMNRAFNEERRRREENRTYQNQLEHRIARVLGMFGFAYDRQPYDKIILDRQNNYFDIEYSDKIPVSEGKGSFTAVHAWSPGLGRYAMRKDVFNKAAQRLYVRLQKLQKMHFYRLVISIHVTSSRYVPQSVLIKTSKRVDVRHKQDPFDMFGCDLPIDLRSEVAEIVSEIVEFALIGPEKDYARYMSRSQIMDYLSKEHIFTAKGERL